MGIIEGPDGIALAVFPDGPQPISSLTNKAWKASEAKDEAPTLKCKPAGLANSSKKEKQVLRKPAAAPFQVPEGWTVETTVRQKGDSKGKVDTYFVETSSGKRYRCPNDLMRKKD